MSVTYWGDSLSQPCRTIEYILKKAGIDHEEKFTELFKVTRSEEFKKNVNPKGKVPVIEHDGEKMFESATICRYLLDVFEGDEKLLPRADLKERVKVDSLLDWNNTTVRPGLTGAVYILYIRKEIFGQEPTEEESKEVMEKANKVLAEIEELVTENAFLDGDNMTIADVQVYNEVKTYSLILKQDLKEYPHTLTWIGKIEEDPVIQEINESMMKRLSEL